MLPIICPPELHKQFQMHLLIVAKRTSVGFWHYRVSVVIIPASSRARKQPGSDPGRR